MEEQTKRSNFTVPNILSVIRILMVGAFIVFYFTDKKSLAFSVIMVSCITDTLDGWIARKFNQITELGKVLDPIADKLFTVSTLLCLCIGGVFPWWFVTVLFVKEFTMLVGGALFIRKTGCVIASRWYGKVTTILVFMNMIFCMFIDASGVLKPENPLSVMPDRIEFIRTFISGVCIVCVIFALYSLIAYAVTAADIYRKKKNETSAASKTGDISADRKEE